MSALFSADRTHRFTLTRIIDANNPRVVQFIGLNPSTADETTLDPTCRRCLRFAESWGFGVYVMTNLFSLRSTDPKGLYRDIRPNPPANDVHLLGAADRAEMIVCAWGTHGAYRGRGNSVAMMLRAYGHTLHCLGRTKAGHPRHPLYLRADTALEIYD